MILVCIGLISICMGFISLCDTNILKVIVETHNDMLNYLKDLTLVYVKIHW